MTEAVLKSWKSLLRYREDYDTCITHTRKKLVRNKEDYDITHTQTHKHTLQEDYGCCLLLVENFWQD